MTSPAFRTARQQGRLAPLKLEHAVLRTMDLAPMLAWYLEVLQADVAFSSSSIAFLCYDEQNHRIALVVRPGTTGASRARQDSIISPSRTPTCPSS